MSTISDFNRIDDCDKIDALCVDASINAYLDENEPNIFKLETSWGDSIIDLTPAVKTAETLTTLYLSPDENPECLIYEPERGDNICIHGDDLSRIVSMKYLKDVDQGNAPFDGSVYMYDGDSNLFENFDLKTVLGDIDTSITNMNTAITELQTRMVNAEVDITNLKNRMSTAEGDITNLKSRMTTAEGNITNLQNRMQTVEGDVATIKQQITALQNTVANHTTRIAAIEALLTKPTGAPSGATLTWGTINLYADPNAVINSSGAVTSLDKTHGLYTHNLNNTAYGDDILG